MARITPIDVIKGISGKYGNGSNDYFATNTSSNRIHLAKYLNKPTGPATPEQLAQMEAFGNQQKMAAAWLRANRPSEENGPKGTEAYQEAQALKKLAHLSNVRQIVLKYMDEDGNVTLPASGTSTPPANSGSTPGSGSAPAGGGSGSQAPSGSGSQTPSGGSQAPSGGGSSSSGGSQAPSGGDTGESGDGGGD